MKLGHLLAKSSRNCTYTLFLPHGVGIELLLFALHTPIYEIRAGFFFCLFVCFVCFFLFLLLFFFKLPYFGHGTWQLPNLEHGNWHILAWKLGCHIWARNLAIDKVPEVAHTLFLPQEAISSIQLHLQQSYCTLKLLDFFSRCDLKSYLGLYTHLTIILFWWTQFGLMGQFTPVLVLYDPFGVDVPLILISLTHSTPRGRKWAYFRSTDHGYHDIAIITKLNMVLSLMGLCHPAKFESTSANQPWDVLTFTNPVTEQKKIK